MSDTTNNIYDKFECPPEDDADPLGLIGRVIAGKYRIEAFIGEGGFGKVYTGININLVHQKVVVKFFTEAKLKDRFEQEAEIISKLSHPGICSLIDYLAEERALVIPFIDGVDLHQQLKIEGPLSADRFMRVGREIMEAIEFAHSKSIAHRDIKPSNIMIGRNNNVYLIDFGIAKEIKENTDHTTVFMGTPDFAAPERHQKKPDYNPFLSDIFELGVTLFYLATKTHVYQDRDHPDEKDWNLPHTRKLTGRLKRVLRKATQPEPSRRYQSVSDMAADFRRIRYPYRKTKSYIRALAFAGAVVVLMIGGDFINQQYRLIDVPPIVSWNADRPGDEATTDSRPPTIPEQSDMILARQDTIINEDTSAAVPPPVEALPVATVNREPITPKMRINILPPGLTRLEVDGGVRTVGQLFETSRGQHEIVIEHENYPIYNTVASVAGDTADLTFDLGKRFPRLDSTNIILVILPRDDRYGFDFTCNGRIYNFTRSRELSFHLKNGLWNIAADVRPLDASVMDELQVDSMVVGVVGKNQTEVIHGRQGHLNVNSGPAGDQLMRLLIYWSESQINVRR